MSLVIFATAVVVVLAVALATVLHRAHELQRRLAAAETAAHTDPLTGLVNRAGLSRWLNRLRSTLVPGEQVAAILVDLDDLKPVNDRHGHAVGDAVLTEIARRIRDSLPRSACAARLGGDEFVVLMVSDPSFPRATRQTEQLARALCDSIRRPVRTAQVPISVTASAGLAVLPAHRIDHLLIAADIAMYRAKATGASVCRYQAQLDGNTVPDRNAILRLVPKSRADTRGGRPGVLTPDAVRWSAL